MQSLLQERMISSREASSSAFPQAQSAQHMPLQKAMGSIPPSCKPTKGRYQFAAGHCSKKQRLCYCRAQLADPDSPPEYIEQEYSVERNAEYWGLLPTTVVKRTLEIGLAFSGWFLDTRLRRGQDPADISGFQAERLRRVLTDLGPAFVKIGQAVSSRPDFVPPSYTRELEKLQDKIPPFPDAEALQIILEELGQPASQVFSEFSPTSVAAASLGQVYKARVRKTGRVVAVKVQRPGVRKAIALDIYIMRYLVGRFGVWRKLNSDLPSLLDEWAASLFRELDYRREARNGTKFKQLYARLEGVYIPSMLHELTTQRVLTMEWVDGVRLRSAGDDPSVGRALSSQDLKLVEYGVQCSLEQMLEEGFYHADPHPGNLMRTSDGKLGYLDFGMMASIEPKIRRGLIRATLHMVNREFQELANDFETLGLLPAGSDKDQVVPALSSVFEKALAGGVSNMSFGTLSGDLGKTMYQFKFRIPSYYTLLVRSLSVLEGIALSSDPSYKVLGAAYPWVARRLLTDSNPELRETLRVLLYKGNRFQFSRLESLLRQAMKSPARVSRARTAPGMAGSANAPTPDPAPQRGGRALDLLLGEEGSYVREIVTDELAKGVDAAWRLSADTAVQDARLRLTALMQGPATWGGLLPSTAGEQPSLPLALLSTLNSFPTLADDVDSVQVNGILSLVRLLREVNDRSSETPTSPVGPPGLLSAQAAEAAAMLQWFVREAQALTPAARAEALRLPFTIGAKLASRIAARALKLVLTNGSSNGRPPALTASAASPARTQGPALTRLRNGNLQPATQPPSQPVVGVSTSTAISSGRPGADVAVSIPPGPSSVAGLSSQGGGRVTPPAARNLGDVSGRNSGSTAAALSGAGSGIDRVVPSSSPAAAAVADERLSVRSGRLRRLRGAGKSAEVAMRSS